MSDQRTGPLRRYRVLELGRAFAVPWAGQMLADLGAEVIKVEALEGDPMRPLGLGSVDDAEGNPTGDRSVFASLNRNKKSITVDLRSPEGSELVRRLAADCDVFIENYKVGDLARRGLDYAAIRAVNPRIVYLSLTAFGQTGPYRLRPGMDNLVQALSGFMSMTGDEGAPPGRSPVSVMDFAGGMHATVGIIAALVERDLNGGEGQFIDVALLDSGIAMLGYKMVASLLTGEEPGRNVLTRGMIPNGKFEAADGWFQMMVGTDPDFRRFCKAVERPDLLEDPRYADRWLRTDNQAPLLADIRAMFLTKPTLHWVDRLVAEGVMAAPVLSVLEAAENEQVRARETIVRITHERGGTLPLVRNAIRFEGTPIDQYRSPPLLGQHGDEVLGALGIDSEEIARLRQEGVIGPAPR